MSKPEDTWKHISEIEAATPTPEENTLREKLAASGLPYDHVEGDMVIDIIKAQRQSDLKKISYMFAIPVSDLEKALESKVER